MPDSTTAGITVGTQPAETERQTDSGSNDRVVPLDTAKAFRSDGMWPRAPSASRFEGNEPSHVRAIRSGEWKLVRHCDPWTRHPEPDQWELYYLTTDPFEQHSLIIHNGPFPAPINEPALPDGLTQAQVVEAATRLHAQLMRQEAALLSLQPPPRSRRRA